MWWLLSRSSRRLASPLSLVRDLATLDCALASGAWTWSTLSRTNSNQERFFADGESSRASFSVSRFKKSGIATIAITRNARTSREFNFEAILGAMLDGLVVIDEQRRIQMANPAFARLVDREAVAAGTFLFETGCATPRWNTPSRRQFARANRTSTISTWRAVPAISSPDRSKRDGATREIQPRARCRPVISRYHAAKTRGRNAARFRGECFARIANAAVDFPRVPRNIAGRSEAAARRIAAHSRSDGAPFRAFNAAGGRRVESGSARIAGGANSTRRRFICRISVGDLAGLGKAICWRKQLRVALECHRICRRWRPMRAACKR